MSKCKNCGHELEKVWRANTWFEQEVYFQAKAKNKSEALKMFDKGEGEVDWNRGNRRGDWENVEEGCACIFSEECSFSVCTNPDPEVI